MPTPAYLPPILLNASALIILFSIPLILRRVPRNRWYGIRTPRAMQGTAADWYAINCKGGQAFLTLGLILMVVSLVVSHFAA